MKGYLIANIAVSDAAGFEAYRSQVPAVIAQHGGRYLVRGGAVQQVERGDSFERLVVIEFPSLEAARRFYGSAAYAPLLALRERTTRSEVVLVEGYEG